MPPRGWRPLPDCLGCGRPTRRSAHQRNGGYCSTCRTVNPAQGVARLELHEWQSTVSRIRKDETARAAARIERLRARREARGGQ